MNNDREEYLSLKKVQESFKAYQKILESKTTNLDKIHEAFDDYCSSVKSFQISFPNIKIKNLLIFVVRKPLIFLLFCFIFNII